MLILVTIVIVFVVLLIFVSRKLSPVPYFPTNKKDISLIIKALDLKKNKTVVDLGAGDGIVIFEAASESFEKSLNNKFYAVEINPVLVFIMNIRKLFHKNRKNIYILQDDFTKMSLKRFQNAVFYLYLSPKYLSIVYKKIKTEVTNPKIVTYFYKIQDLKVKNKIKNQNITFLY